MSMIENSEVLKGAVHKFVILGGKKLCMMHDKVESLKCSRHILCQFCGAKSDPKIQLACLSFSHFYR